MNYEYYKRYCNDIESVENFEKALADDFKGWDVHHRLETHNSDGERRVVDISQKELKALDMYYHRPANELIFLKKKDHKSLHIHPMKGKPFSDTTKLEKSMLKSMLMTCLLKVHQTTKSRKKRSKAMKSENNIMYSKHHSEKTKKKISEASKGRHWYNNGKVSIKTYECPEGYVPGRIYHRK